MAVAKLPSPSEVSEMEGPKAIATILNYCQPFASVSRKYNYLMFKILKFQRLRQFIHENSFSYPRSHSPTSPVCGVAENSQDMENTETNDYTQSYKYANSTDHTQTFQYTDASDNIQSFQYNNTIDNTWTFQYNNTIDNTQTFQYTGTVDNTQPFQYNNTIDNTTFQYNDTIDNTRTVQYNNTIDNTQTLQNTDTINNTQAFQYMDSIYNTEGIQNTENNAVFHSKDSQAIVFARSSRERKYQETPPSPIYTAQTYQQYYKFRNVPGSSTMTYYRDLENPNRGTITSITSARKTSTLSPRELIPIQNFKMRQLALLEAQQTPVIDHNNTFGEFGMVPMINIL
ncbi:uncharacterized protein LOC127185201 [Acomys russatus]|uniref:uncharacterized protein LOC127185201 n=1 Tax=Acomys russatus TaxID=60746 RepID=UPI0021E20E7C|nr:uncharacterized protein LOC127185201 [Acomys russatus]